MVKATTILLPYPKQELFKGIQCRIKGEAWYVIYIEKSIRAKYINDSMFIEDLTKWRQCRQYNVMLEIN
jgi:hypothetical protein